MTDMRGRAEPGRPVGKAPPGRGRTRNTIVVIRPLAGGSGGGWGEAGQSARQSRIVASIDSVGRSPAIFLGRSAKLGRPFLPTGESSGSRCGLPRRSPCLREPRVAESVSPGGDDFRHSRSPGQRVKRRLQMHLASPTGRAHAAVSSDIMKTSFSATCWEDKGKTGFRVLRHRASRSGR
jgi:hypothetical protein